jgi:signal transduction histidine kinase
MLCEPEELKTLFLFEKLDDEQLAWLCRDGRIETHEPGRLFAEGDPASCFYVLMDGEIRLTKNSSGQEIETTRSDYRGVYAGGWSSYLGDKVDQRYAASMYVIKPATFFVLEAAVFGTMVRSWFPMAVHLLEGLFYGQQNARNVLDRRERLLALGQLSAGLTHELNNPAAAAARAVPALRERVAGMRHKLGMISAGKFDSSTLAELVRLQEEAAEKVAKAAKAPDLSPREEADREDRIADWLAEHGISDSWELAPNFVQAGIDVDWLEAMHGTLDACCTVDVFSAAVRWLNYTVETELLMNEIGDATGRISALVGAARQYSQMDRAPFQVADLRELLESTLVMLSRKLGDEVKVVKDFDPALPEIPCYPAELNQVWTNIIDNAVAAMGGSGTPRGTLTVRTYRDGDSAAVEIGDTGPGIPADIRDRIFDPFFTTKPVGEGTGLGLDISYRIVADRHGGDIRVTSVPGDTRFTVRIPLDPVSPA